MRITAYFLTGCLATVLLVSSSRLRAADAPVWQPISDGKTLAGWHKNGLGDWTVEEGAFVGRSNKEKLYGHLVSDAQYKDFTVRFQFRCPSGDSGFFIRTQMKEPDKTHGLQIQVGPCGSGTGGIYESYGRGWLKEKPTLENEKYCYREGTWNEMMISAHGNRVIVHVNGIKTRDITDDQIAQGSGVFALQMHSRVVNETRFKDLAILQQGKIVPKTFLFSSPPTLKPGKDGSILLHAAAGVGMGPKIQYLPDWGAFGHFTAKCAVQWPVEIAESGVYEVWLEWSVDDKHAGNTYVFQVGEHERLSGTVQKSGPSGTYKRQKIGSVNLSAGSHKAIFRAGGTFKTTLLNLREITLVPTR